MYTGDRINPVVFPIIHSRSINIDIIKTQSVQSYYVSISVIVATSVHYYLNVVMKKRKLEGRISPFVEYRFTLGCLITRYATASSPAISNTASKHRAHGFLVGASAASAGASGFGGCDPLCMTDAPSPILC